MTNPAPAIAPIDFSLKVLFEVGDSLAHIRQLTMVALEQSYENSSLANLDTAVTKALNTFRLINCSGAELLCSEFKSTLQAIADKKIDQEIDVAPVLVLASEKLNDYVAYLRAGGQDLPLALLPCCNNLRACHGKNLLSEAVIVSPLFQIPEVSALENLNQTQLNKLATCCEQSRLPLMQTLVDWFRTPSEHHTQMLMEVCSTIQQRIPVPEISDIWLAAEAVAASIESAVLEDSAAVKKLFAQLERYLKSCSECASSAEPLDYPTGLLKNLLYYVALSESSHPSVGLIKSRYRLAELLPPRSSIEKARDALGGPAANLSEAICSSVSREIVEIKQTLENLSDNPKSSGNEVSGLVERLSQLSSTLLLLGLGDAKFLNERVSARLRETDFSTVDTDALRRRILSSASDLLRVEAALEEFQHGKARSSMFAENFESGIDIPGQLSVYQFDSIVSKCLSEAVRGLKSVQSDYLSVLLGKHGVEQLVEPAQTLQNIGSALQILPLPEIKPLLDGASSHLLELASAGKMPNSDQQVSFADLIASCEYYLDADVQTQPAAGDLLMYAEHALDRLNVVVSNHPARTTTESAGGQVDVTGHSSDMDEPSIPLTSGQVSSVSNTVESIQANSTTSSANISPFVETSLSHFENINQHLQRWKQTGDRDALAQIQVSWQQLRDDGFDNRSIALSDLGDSNERMIARLNRRASENRASSEQVSQVQGLLEESCGMVLQLINHIGMASLDNNDDTTTQSTEEPVEGFDHLIGAIEAAVSISGAESEPNWDDSDDSSEDELGQTLDLTEHAADDEWLEKTLSISHAASTSLDELGETLQIDSESYATSVSTQQNAQLISEQTATDATESLSVSNLIEHEAEDDSAEVDDTVALSPDLIKELSQTGTSSQSMLDTQQAQADWSESSLNAAADQTLSKVFFKECHFHLESLKDQLGSALVNEKLTLPSEALLRSLHTLNGSARTAGYTSIVEMSEPLEHIARNRLSNNLAFNRNELVVISDAVLALDSLCVSLANEEEIPENQEEVLQALSTFASEIAVQEHDATGTSDIQRLFIEEAGELLDRMQPSVKQMTLASGDGALQDTEVNLSDAVQALQADLHTLKGAAHVAGYRAIADLTHALEGAIHRWREEPVIDSRRMDLLQDTLDAITMNLEQARSGGALGQFEWLIGELGKNPKPDLQIEDLDSTLTLAETEESTETLTQSEATEDHDDTVQLDVASSNGDKDSRTTGNSEAGPSHWKQNELTSGAQKNSRVLTAIGEQSRLDAGAVNRLSDLACEGNVHQAMVSESIHDMQDLMVDLDKTTERLGRKLREMQDGHSLLPQASQKSISTTDDQQDHTTRFDPDELERHTQTLENSRQLGEILADFEELRRSFHQKLRDSEERLSMSVRIGSDIQQTLVQSKLIPFNLHANRLASTVRQSAASLNKTVEWKFEGADHRLERGLHKAILAPLEHLIRNCVFHGIESTADRVAAGKSPAGLIHLSVRHEGAMLIVTIRDDGVGIDRDAVREKLGTELALADDDDSLLEFLFEPGFTTVESAEELAGRGVGLDVVRRFVREHRGHVSIESTQGEGTSVHMKFTQPEVINQVVVVEHRGISFGLPVNYVHTVQAVDGLEGELTFGGKTYPMMQLSDLLPGSSDVESGSQFRVDFGELSNQAVLIEAGGKRAAIRVHAIPGYRELVTSTAGRQVESLSWVTGASVLANGSCVILPDLPELMSRLDLSKRRSPSVTESAVAVSSEEDVLVVDDSVTMRAYAAKIIRSTGKRAVFARDGIEALNYLEKSTPALILLDLEMPRLDGFGLLKKLRSMPTHESTPVAVVSSRSSAKHREQAADLNVVGYLVKPYRSDDLCRVMSRASIVLD